MTPNLNRLHAGVWSFLEDSTEERVTRLYSPKWVAYARGNEALARMGHLTRTIRPAGACPAGCCTATATSAKP